MFIFGQKLEMTQIFENDKVIPVTVVKVDPCWVTQIKSDEKDGYKAVQIGGVEIKEKNIRKPQKGHLAKSGKSGLKVLREFIVDDVSGYELGRQIDLSMFEKGDKVKISGISKAKGFQGVVKRHGFKGGPATHGTKHSKRAPGSIGCSFPERVFKGKRMAGRMGGERITVKNLKIVSIDKEKNLLMLKGAVPGKKGTLLEIKKV